jgi:hypothetical protein
MSITHAHPVLDAAHAKSMLLPKPTEDGMAMVGHGPDAVFLCNTANLSHNRRREDIATRNAGQDGCQ